MGDERTETHELRADTDGEDDQVQSLYHLRVAVGAFGDEDGANVEQDSLGKVDERARNSVSSSLYESTPHPSGERTLDRSAEAFEEDPLEAHRADAAHVNDDLDNDK